MSAADGRCGLCGGPWLACECCTTTTAAHPTLPFSVWYNPAYEAWVVEPHLFPNGKPVSPFPIVFRVAPWAHEVCAVLNRLAGEMDS